MSATTQAFHRGDRVRVRSGAVGGWACQADGTMTEIRRHRAGEHGIVLGSYADQYGGSGERPSYTLMFGGACESWFEEADLTLLWHGTEDDIRAEIAEREARESHERDLGWIAAHWLEIRGHLSSATCEALMRRVGIDQPWGSQGEGMAWHANMRQTFAALDPILSAMPDNPELTMLGIRLPPIDVRFGE